MFGIEERNYYEELYRLQSKMNEIFTTCFRETEAPDEIKIARYNALEANLGLFHDMVEKMEKNVSNLPTGDVANVGSTYTKMENNDEFRFEFYRYTTYDGKFVFYMKTIYVSRKMHEYSEISLEEFRKFTEIVKVREEIMEERMNKMKEKYKRRLE